MTLGHPGVATQSSVDAAEQQFVTARAHHQAGDLAQAELGYRAALAIAPRHADAMHLLGVLHAQKSAFQEAEHYIRAALAIKDIWAFHDNLGKCLQGQGKLADALTAFQRAVELKPDHIAAHDAIATLALHSGDFVAAEKAYRAIARLNSSSASAHVNLANILFELGQNAEAEQEYRLAIAQDAHYATAHYNLANLLSNEKRWTEAEVAYLRALEINPDYVKACNNLGNLYLYQKKYLQAENAYRQACRIDTESADSLSNLGNCLMEAKQYAAAEEVFRNALAINPHASHPTILVGFSARHLCNWRAIAEDDQRVIDLLEQTPTAIRAPFPAIVVPGIRADHQRQIACNKAEQDFAAVLRQAPLVDPRTYRERSRLRIGYLSADFHEHATMFLLSGVLESHDRERFEVTLYSTGPAVNDATRARASQACNRFRDVSALGDRDAAELIVGDGIDILVDLKGYTEDNRLGVSAWRPAPVIVSWLGFPGTLGHPRLADYIIGDVVVTPPEHARYFSETLALMPDCYQPNDRRRPIGTTPSRTEVGLPEQGFVFASFNQAYKLTPEIFDLWCRLLAEIDDSVLWMLETNAHAVANLQAELSRHGIAADRLIFAKKLAQAEHLGRLRLADLALDTYPCGSHTTASDALWAGLPLIARMGQTFASRVSSSLLHAIGLADLVATDAATYFMLAKTFATDASHRASIKKRLAAGREGAPLFDTERFTRNLEHLYADIWRQQASGQRQAIIPSDTHMEQHS